MWLGCQALRNFLPGLCCWGLWRFSLHCYLYSAAKVLRHGSFTYSNLVLLGHPWNPIAFVGVDKSNQSLRVINIFLNFAEGWQPSQRNGGGRMGSLQPSRLEREVASCNGINETSRYMCEQLRLVTSVGDLPSAVTPCLHKELSIMEAQGPKSKEFLVGDGWSM